MFAHRVVGCPSAFLAAALVLAPLGIASAQAEAPAGEPAPPVSDDAPVAEAPSVGDTPPPPPPADDAAVEPQPAPPPAASTPEDVPRPSFVGPGPVDPRLNPYANPDVSPPPVADPSETRRDDAPRTPREKVHLKLKNGQWVEGLLIEATPEGWALEMPGGEIRFFDALDVAEHDVKRASTPTVVQKAWLLPSLLWPGAGQIAYGAIVQDGKPWERSALVVGVGLAALGVLAMLVVGGGVAVGYLMPDRIGFGPLNPMTIAGGIALGLAFLVGLLDAGGRLLID